MARSVVEFPKGIFEIDDNVVNAVNKGMNEITDDLLRVAQQRSPVDEGTLEQSGTSQVVSSKRMIKGFVSFSARNKGYNYALKMDKGSYKLGKKSLSKSSRGVRSKFSKASMKVGSGYLSDSAEKCKDGYIKHINEQVGMAIVKSGFKVK